MDSDDEFAPTGAADAPIGAGEESAPAPVAPQPTPAPAPVAAPTSKSKIRKQPVQQEAEPAAYQATEDLLDSLKLLDYETKFCKPKNFKALDRFMFARPSNPPAEQFHYFTSLVSWLMTLQGNHGFPPPSQFDDPNATVSNILMELKKMGLQADYPPTKIKVGYGDVVISVLKHLVASTLKKTSFKYEKPVHHPDGYAEEVDGDNDEIEADQPDEEIEDAVAEGEEEDYYMGDVGGTGGGSKAVDEQEVAMLESKVDPNAWKLELERVRPILKVSLPNDNKEWRSHLEQIKKHHEAISQNFQETAHQLEKMGGEISKSAEKIYAREQTLNNQFQDLVAEYKVAQEALQEAETTYKGSSSTITQYTNELAKITEELESVKQQMEEVGTNMTDATPLAKIKTALQTIKSEVKQLDVRIGIASTTLLQFKVKDRGTMRGGKSKVPLSSIPGMDDDDDDDDDDEYDAF